MRRTYVGKDIIINDERSLCSHGGACFKLLPEVFAPLSRPWIRPDAAEIEKIIDVIDQCPTGALSYSINSTTKEMEGRSYNAPTGE